MSSTERNRHDLINQMERLYLDRAWSDQEMADRVGTGRENVWKIRTKVMELKMGIPFFTENGRHRIDRTAYVANIKLTPSETLALYIGGRRLQQHTKTGQKDVANALEKLANALHKPLVAKMVQAAKQVLDQEQDEQQAKNLQGIMAGWMTGRRLRLKHRVPHANVTREYVVTPLQLEPAVWGDGVYLIGYSDYHQGIATFKLSRIERVTVTTEPFEQDAEFDSHALLHHAWGIWHSDNDPVTVRLQFTPYVTPYVKETIWHPEQTIQDLPDGGCIWQAEVAQPREMLPWIRGWGSDVEVLEPDWVAKSVKEHAQRLAKMYQIESTGDSANGRLQLLWGKTSKTSSDYHPAIYHMLDVAHIAQHMLSSQANPRWRNVLAATLNVPSESLIEWLPWLIALHDVGKLSVPFQALNDFHRSRLEQEGFDFGKYGTEYKMHHTILGRIVLEPWAKETFGKNRTWRQIFLDMVAGHHGKYQLVDSNTERQWKSLKEDEQWAKLRTEAIEFLRQLLLINLPAAWSNPQNLSAAIVALNGFTILCDWLGSDEQYFTPQPFVPPIEYVGHSKSKARARVADAGFFVPTLSRAPTDFKALFGGWEPRPLQTAVAQIPDDILEKPTLTIVESLTGEGKTEAALTLAHRIGRLRQTDELYIALPTTATSNAMFKRLQTHLRDNLGLDAKVSLIHGQAFLVEDDLRIKPLSNEDGEQPASLEWFSPKKRALLAPFGVGTVDQAELSALNVKHNALRLIGLAGKVVILDEVHAYDTYMTTIIQAMLKWLSALGSSVILLSATLPLNKRRELIQAYTGVGPTDPQNEAYPYLLTINQKGEQTEANPPAAQASKQIELYDLNFAEDDAMGKAEWLLEKIANGGTVCWITNLVDRAQGLFRAVKEMADEDVDLLLLHARFPLTHRQEIEEKILERYGKVEDGKRPFKGIVIGTQVLEQSLDLDFDLMVSDLAPIDLLLQRVGRLHRHPNRQNRSDQHPTPKFFVNAALKPDASLKIGADKFYTEYILLKSWEAIQTQIRTTGQFDLPHDYRPSIEHVYAEAEPAMDSPFREAWNDLTTRQDRLMGEAKLRLANSPDEDDPFYEGSKKEFREDEDSNAWVVAQTRYIERETITIIVLEKPTSQEFKLLDEDDIFSLHAQASREIQLKMLQFSVKISERNAVQAIKAQEQYAAFQESALIKRCYPLFVEKEVNSDTWKSKEVEQSISLNLNLGVVFYKNS